VFDAILDNRLLLAAIIFLLLLMVPVVIVCSRKLREPSGLDRRKRSRLGVDRRA